LNDNGQVGSGSQVVIEEFKALYLPNSTVDQVSCGPQTSAFLDRRQGRIYLYGSLVKEKQHSGL